MKTLPPDARFRAPGVIALLITVVAALMVPVSAASAASAAAKSKGLSVTALDVTPKSVKPGLGQATVTMTWTITDNAALAATVGGDLFIRMQGSTPGTYLGMAYDIPFAVASDSYDGATWVSGTAAQSSYSYVFAVPVYANDTKARWTVSEIDAHDDLGNTLAATDSALAGFTRTITTTAQVDSTAPALPSVQLAGYNPPAYFYDGQHPAVVTYQIGASDNQSGFWKGTLRLVGPSGQSLTTSFAYLDNRPANASCFSYYASHAPAAYAWCNVPVTFPAASVGTWTLASVTLTDNAGNTATYPSPDPLPVGLSNDSTLRASGFSVSPNPLNTWGQAQTTQLTFSADGVRQGLTSVVVDAGYDCNQQTQTPTQNLDGTYSVPITMRPYFYDSGNTCQITGLVLTDGAGDLALYGSDYGAPDPAVTITRVPDTTAPTATTASLTSSTISAADYAYLNAQVTVSAPIAPVEYYSVTVYDASGNPTNIQTTGFTGPVFDGGIAVMYINVYPLALAPGTYTVGFTITDAGGLSNSYGGPGQPPVPGGPLTLTVTP